MNPLDFLGRIKVKLGIVIVLAVGTAFVVNEVGIQSGLTRETRIAVAVVLALIMVQVLAMGMTKPLRQMASAAQTIAKGSYTLRVNSTSRDEVGELARAFNAMAADLGEVDRQRRELVANVSHELRTPITGLRAVLENVVDGVSAPDPVTMRTALAQTERLGRLVAQLLDLSRLDSGTRLIEAEAVELAPLIEQAVREASLAREDVVIRSSVPADLVVRADPDLLAQVLANLLDNAVRHSPPSGEVVIRATASGASVRMEVADQGPGIPASARARVFERFSRLDAGRAADSGGAGLGLAIVKEIVELHGGSIRIEDCAGCRMVVDLPGRTTMAEAPLEGGRDTGDVERPLPAAVVPAGAGEAAGAAAGAAAPDPAGQPVDAVPASGGPASPVLTAGEPEPAGAGASPDGGSGEKVPAAGAASLVGAGPGVGAEVATAAGRSGA
ncbi:sensor histidine kinase, partial [Nonomuraea maheshkhaliensis]|uniref:sensor histidine kinase n=1 Tax=Nonomuraea maheshkhaliensis TaxID=419590 RepID=UPI0031F89DE1